MALKLLVVDDDPSILRLIKTMVEPWGYQISILEDSRQAVQLVETEKYDGFVFDIMMPHMDGFQLAQRARASLANSETPVVMITGLDDIETMRKCFGIGVTLFLNKPFNYERLHNLFYAAKGPLLREQRRSARLPYRTTVDCSFGEHSEHRFRAESINIGETGMLVEPSGGLEVGGEVLLEFSLGFSPGALEKPAPRARKALFSDATPLEAGPRKLRARIVRKSLPDSIGVRFISLTPQDRQALQRFVFGRGMP